MSYPARGPGILIPGEVGQDVSVLQIRAIGTGDRIAPAGRDQKWGFKSEVSCGKECLQQTPVVPEEPGLCKNFGDVFNP